MKYYYDTEATKELKFRPLDETTKNWESVILESFVELSESDGLAIQQAIKSGLDFELKSDNTIICATSDCDVWNVGTEAFELDEVQYVTDKKAQFIQDLKEYRWDLFNTQLYVGVQIINVDIEGRQELSFNTQSFSAMAVEDRPATVPFKELDDAGWLDVDPTAAIAWQIMISMADSLESRTAQKAVENGVEGVGGIAQLTTKEELDSFKVVSEFDAILKPVLSANLVKYAYPIKYHNEDAV